MRVNIRSFLMVIILFTVSSLMAVTGDNYKSAKLLSIGKSQTVTLVDELWDGESSGNGVYYFKVSLKKGTEYTFWSEGSAEVNDAYLGTVDKEWGDVWGDFSSETTYDELNFWLTVSAEDWEWDDELSGGTYYLVVTGEIGGSVTIHSSYGARSELLPAGIYENPKSLSISTSVQSHSGTLINGEYYFKASLEAGTKYIFSTQGGGTNEVFTLDIYPDEDEYFDFPDVYEEPIDDHNSIYTVLAQGSGTHIIIFSGIEDESSFTLNYHQIPTRLPSEHDYISLNFGTENEVASDSFFAGRRNAEDSGCYDNIIDEQLFRLDLSDDEIYVFESFGDQCSSGMVMEVYNKNGEILARNYKKSPTDSYTKIVFSPPKSGDYWVGVCQNSTGSVEANESTLTVIIFTDELEGQVDEWDPRDNTWERASALAPNPIAVDDYREPVINTGVAQGVHTLGISDWSDWFCIAARKGLVYKLQVDIEAGWEDFQLCADVYIENRSRLTLFDHIENLAEGGEFEADDHETYYIEVYLDGSKGLDYGPYTLYSSAFSDEGDLGALQVNIGGATVEEGAGWSLESDGRSGPVYPGGSTILLSAGDQVVLFESLRNWSAPLPQVVMVSGGTEPTVVNVKYSDLYDPDDNERSGATELRVDNDIESVARSLWVDDPADWFELSLKGGTYITLGLESFEGSTVIELYDEHDKLLATGEYIRFLSEEGGDYTFKVKHFDSSNSIDSSYVLNYQSHLVGAVEIDKERYSVREKEAFAEVSVSRSAKEGDVRVRYWTEAISATPGLDYKPIQGELEWLNGDGKDKDILIPLIPDLYPVWEEDKTFYVNIEVVGADELKSGEFIPALGVTTQALITITESERKDPGEIEFVGYSVAGDDEVLSFENSRRPAISVNAGDSITLWASRVEGSDGVVSVQLSTDDDDATAGSDYESIGTNDTLTLTWASGDSSPQPVTIFTEVQEESYFSSRSFDLEMSVDRDTSGGVKLGTSSVEIEIRDSEVTATADEWADALDDADSDLDVKVKASECWFIDKDGNLLSIPIDAGDSTDFSVSFEGPGILEFSASLLSDTEDDSSLTYTIGRDDPINCEDGGIVELYIEAGKESVEFELDRPRGSTENAEVYAIFNVISGVPFEWTPLECVTDCLPVDDALVLSQEFLDLSWNSDHEQGFRLILADSKSNLTKAPLFTKYVLESEYCIGCAVGDPVLKEGESYYWQVNTVIPGADTSDSTLDLLVSEGPVMTFTIGEAGDVSTQELVEPILAEFANTTGDGYRLVQGLYTKIGPFITEQDGDFEIDYDDSDLPKGLKLTTIRGDGTYIVGVPSTVGSYATEITSTKSVGREKYNGDTFAFNFEVEAAGLAAGDFSGVLNSLWSDRNHSMAFVDFSASEKGRISAKVNAGGSSYSFKATGFTEEVILPDSGNPGLKVELIDVDKYDKVLYTNRLEVIVSRGEWSEDAMYESDNYCFLTLWREVEGNNGEDIVVDSEYIGTMVRDDSDIDEALDSLSKYVGYYTVSLPLHRAVDGVPAGAGYVTITIDERGRVKYAGLMGDGTRVSGSSSFGNLITPEGDAALWIPIFYAKKGIAFGGWLTLIADESESLVVKGWVDWFNADPDSTRLGEEGFGVALNPTGGFYDKLINLQTYYLDHDLSFSGAYDLPEALDDEFTELVCYPENGAIALDIIDDDFEVEDSELVKDENNRRLVKLEESVNPCDLTIKFKQSTGIYSGSFSVWYATADGSEQEEVSNFKYYGIMTLQKDAGSLYSDVPGLGFYLHEEQPDLNDRRKWTGSYLFEIKSNYVERDWSERSDEEQNH